MRRIGYIRVSTKDQNPDRQMDAVKALGIQDKYIYVDKISGKSFDRPKYQKMLSILKKGDIVIIKSIDRLGRNYDEILEQWRFLTRENLPLRRLKNGLCHYETGEESTVSFRSCMKVGYLSNKNLSGAVHLNSTRES